MSIVILFRSRRFWEKPYQHWIIRRYKQRHRCKRGLLLRENVKRQAIEGFGEKTLQHQMNRRVSHKASVQDVRVMTQAKKSMVVRGQRLCGLPNDPILFLVVGATAL
jgi:hypothetical protein